MADESTKQQEKTFTRSDVDKLIKENNAKHQNKTITLTNILSIEF